MLSFLCAADWLYIIMSIHSLVVCRNRCKRNYYCCGKCNTKQSNAKAELVCRTPAFPASANNFYSLSVWFLPSAPSQGPYQAVYLHCFNINQLPFFWSFKHNFICLLLVANLSPSHLWPSIPYPSNPSSSLALSIPFTTLSTLNISTYWEQ